MLNRVESTEYSQVTTLVHTQEYPITLPVVGIGQLTRLNARCLSIPMHTIIFSVHYVQVSINTLFFFNSCLQSIKQNVCVAMTNYGFNSHEYSCCKNDNMNCLVTYMHEQNSRIYLYNFHIHTLIHSHLTVNL